MIECDECDDECDDDSDDQCRSQHLIAEGRKAWMMAQQWNERKSQMGEALARKN